MRKIVPVVLLLAAALLAWWWFGKNGSDRIGPDDPLAFAPADTPYVFGNIRPLDDAVVLRWMTQADASLAQWRQQLDRMIPMLESDTSDDAEGSDTGAETADARPQSAEHAALLGWLRAAKIELDEASDARMLAERFGLGLDTRMAIYGIGLAPVMRMTLKDPARLQEGVARLQKNAGQTLTTLDLPGAQGWRFQLPELKLDAVMAIVDGQLVATFAPGENTAALRTLLGLERPARSLADTGQLQKLNRTEHFTAYGSGYLDTAALIAQLKAPATPLETAFLAPFDAQKPVLGPECDADLARVTRAFPRAIFGYTKIDGTRMDAVSRLETSPELAKGLQTLLAPMPGLDAKDQTLLSFGLALKTTALPPLVNGWASENTANPFTCDATAWINRMIGAMREGANHPAVYASGPMANSLVLALDKFSFDLEQKKLTDLVGRLVIGSDNPAGLIATARSLVPQLASMDLQPDAPAQPLPTDLLAGVIDAPVFVAMAGKALGVAVGPDEAKHLPGHLKAADHSSLLYVHYRGELMGEIAKLIRETAEDMPAPYRAELLANAQMLEDGYARYMDRVELRMDVTDRGVDLRQSIILRP